MRFLPPTVAIATLGAFAYTLVERVWLLAGVVVVILAIEVFFLPRMTGPFELSGRRFRFRGILVEPDNPTQSPPLEIEPPDPPLPPAPPGTIQSSEDQSA
jgi:hypothetical protein